MHDNDNVATAVKDIPLQEKIEFVMSGESREIEIADSIPHHGAPSAYPAC